MNKFKKILTVSLTAALSLSCFAGLSVNSSAAQTEEREMTADELHSLLGDTLRGTFWDGNSYQACEYSFYGVSNSVSSNSYDPSTPLFNSNANSTSYTYLIYLAPIKVANQTDLGMTADIEIPLSFTGTSFKGGCGFSISGIADYPMLAYNDSSLYPYNFVNAKVDGSVQHFSAYLQTSIRFYAWMRINFNKVTEGTSWYGFRMIPVTKQSYSSDTFTIDMNELIGTGVASSASGQAFAIMCPIISTDGTVTSDLGWFKGDGTSGTNGDSGSSGGGTSQGDINVTVDVDMSETNGLLGGLANLLQSIWDAITSIPSKIVEGIAAIFVPEEGFMDEQLASLQGHFAWYEQIRDAGEIFRTAFAANNFSDEPVVIIGPIKSKTYDYASDGSFVLDMNDFAPYRGTVQTIIRIFLWLAFFWRLFARLPDIISGAGMASHDWFSMELKTGEFGGDAARDIISATGARIRNDADVIRDRWSKGG